MTVCHVLRLTTVQVIHRASAKSPSQPNWAEVETYVRMVASLGSYSRQPGPNQLFVPEIFHLVTLTAAEGPALVRKAVFEIIINLLQALYISRTEDVSGSELLKIIDDCSTPSVLQLFGLARESPTSEYTCYNVDSDKEKLDSLDKLSRFLLRIAEVASGSQGLSLLGRYSNDAHIFLIPRSSEHLESTVDEPGHLYSVPVLADRSNALLRHDSHFGHLGCR